MPPLEVSIQPGRDLEPIAEHVLVSAALAEAGRDDVPHDLRAELAPLLVVAQPRLTRAVGRHPEVEHLRAREPLLQAYLPGVGVGHVVATTSMDTLADYAPGSVAEQVYKGRNPECGDCEVSVLFVDLRGYCAFAQSRELAVKDLESIEEEDEDSLYYDDYDDGEDEE